MQKRKNSTGRRMHYCIASAMIRYLNTVLAVHVCDCVKRRIGVHFGGGFVMCPHGNPWIRSKCHSRCALSLSLSLGFAISFRCAVIRIFICSVVPFLRFLFVSVAPPSFSPYRTHTLCIDINYSMLLSKYPMCIDNGFGILVLCELSILIPLNHSRVDKKKKTTTNNERPGFFVDKKLSWRTRHTTPPLHYKCIIKSH